MNTQLLKYVVEVERTGSISQAAENLFMGQPNLSKAIKELEASIGISIFKRTTKGVIPTQQGAEFLIYAKNLLLQIDEMELRFNPRIARKANFKLSAPRTLYYACALTEFLKEYNDEKELNVNFREANAKMTISGVVYASYNLGIIRYQNIYEAYFINLVQESSLKYCTLMEFNAVALTSKNFKTKSADEYTSETLYEMTEVACADTLVPYAKNALAQKPGSADMRNRILVNERASQTDVVRNVPGTFMWSSPMMEDYLASSGLDQRKCNVANNIYKDILIYRPNYKFTLPDKLFIKRLQDMTVDLAEFSTKLGVSSVTPGKKIITD